MKTLAAVAAVALLLHALIAGAQEPQSAPSKTPTERTPDAGQPTQKKPAEPAPPATAEATPKPAGAAPADGRFTPSEKISEDLSVSFPSDI